MSKPKEFNTLTACLTIKGADKAIALYEKAFDAKVIHRLDCEDTGKVMHAALQIGDSQIMLGEEMPECGHAPGKEGSSVSFYLYYDNLDAAWNQAIKAGMKEKMPLTDMFWGDRSGVVTDPFGYSWNIATQVKQMSMDEIKKAAGEWMKEMKNKAA